MPIRCCQQAKKYLCVVACKNLMDCRADAEIMRWSASTAVRMAKHYGHIGQAARREATLGDGDHDPRFSGCAPVLSNCRERHRFCLDLEFGSRGSV
jgi:hypothetical protein